MVDAVWQILLELAPWLLLGAVVSGLLHALLPEGFVHRQLTGVWGVPKAVALGVPLPLCSCGVIPAGVGLKRDGASDGAAVAFLIATPQTGVDSILVSASFLGWPFALFKVGAAAVTALPGLARLGCRRRRHRHAARPVGRRRPGGAVVASGAGARRRGGGPDLALAGRGAGVKAAITVFVPTGALAGTAMGSGVVASSVSCWSCRCRCT
ncbi:MAG: permease [Alphaproteobacteria bacterium]|nr:permease [Alphaproteobacteria bacterium]